MSQDQGAPPKKDLTGIMDLPQADPVKDPSSPTGENPFEFNELVPVEQIDDFASLEQIGMMDHPVPEELEHPEEPSKSDLSLAPESNSDLNDFVSFSEPTPTPDPPPTIDTENSAQDQPFESSLPPEEISALHESFTEEVLPPAPPKPVLEELKTYAESKKEKAFDSETRNEFHLLITGDFDPYSRDKLLLFLTENSIGVTSSELDFQIKSNRVLLPRISEFSGIKLIQELRDSGLSFHLRKPLEESSMIPDDGDSRSYHFEANLQPRPLEIPIIPSQDVKSYEFQVLDSIRMVQFLRAEILEVEQSELFQELLDRMTEALRKRAKLKGAHALTHLNHTITPLRLPSQYQVELSASLLKRI